MKTILSENSKTSVSLNLPIKGHCNKTEICKKTCYAKQGPMRWKASVNKQKQVSEYLKGSDISQLVFECLPYSAVRISGSGDLLTCHVNNIIKLAEKCPHTTFWGMTRKPNIAKAINNKLPNLSLLVTVDASSPKTTWNYDGTLCFGPRRAQDIVPNDSRIITVFPYHCHGKIVQNVPQHPKDCPAIRHKVPGCLECRQCFN